jgi:hypothetical protein
MAEASIQASAHLSTTAEDILDTEPMQGEVRTQSQGGKFSQSPDDATGVTNKHFNDVGS